MVETKKRRGIAEIITKYYREMFLRLERKYLNLFCYKETCHRRQIANTSTDLSQDEDSTSFDSDTSRMTFLSSCHLIRFIVEVMILSDPVLSERLSPSAAGPGGPEGQGLDQMMYVTV